MANYHTGRSLRLTGHVLIVYGILLIISSTVSYGGEEKEKDRPNKITANEVKAGELKAFAAAFIKVQAAIHETTEGSGVQTYKKTTSIVKHEGLTVKRYTQLSQRMNEDPDFKKSVEEMIQTIKEEEDEKEGDK
ncbi:MAG: DUF4168 domain-containing protein [Candidatus Brocadiales bacterium]|nr:DUF4168 domain-containing protein [Candidatus Bathyanammoxibius amoris]